MRASFIFKAAGDVLVINIAYLLAFLLRFAGTIPEHNLIAYVGVIPWISVASVIVFYAYGLYSSERLRWDERFAGIMASVIVLFLLSITLSYMLTQFAFPRLVFLISFPLQAMFLTLFRRVVWVHSTSRKMKMRVALAGELSTALQRARYLVFDSHQRFSIAGIITGDVQPSTQIEYKVVEFSSNITDFLISEKVDTILVCAGTPLKERLRLALEADKIGISIFMIPDIYELLISQSRFEQIDGIPVLAVNSTTSGSLFIWKRFLDVALAIVALIPSTFVLLFAVLALKIESPFDKILFKQKRVGKDGKVFYLYKLRSMLKDAEKDTGPVLSTDDDPRITRVGKILRTLRIDEIPQLLNIIKGDMSFVGPRPERPFFVEQYNQKIDGYDLRHNIDVGLTGLAQVEGKYDTSAEDKLCFDLVYSRSASPAKDLWIILRTIKTILTKGKAM